MSSRERKGEKLCLVITRGKEGSRDCVHVQEVVARRCFREGREQSWLRVVHNVTFSKY
jgi:hypothetical protein